MKRMLTSLLIAWAFSAASLQAQRNTDGSMPQYLYSAFSPAVVKMRNGTRNRALLNYNIVTEKMVYFKDEDYYDMISTELIDTVYLAGSKFIPVGKIFHEVLADGPIGFFIQHKGTLMSAGAPAGYGGTSQVSNTKSLTSVELSGMRYNLSLPSDFTVSLTPVFWIRIGEKYESFINERQFLRLFPEQEDKLKDFIKKSRVKFDKPATLAKLAIYCNSMPELMKQDD